MIIPSKNVPSLHNPTPKNTIKPNLSPKKTLPSSTSLSPISPVLPPKQVQAISPAKALVGLTTIAAIGVLSGDPSLALKMGVLVLALLAQSKLSQQMMVGLLLTESLLKGVGVAGRVTTLGFSDQSCAAYSLNITGAKYIVDGKESDAVSKLLNSTQVTGDFKEAIRSGCQNLEAILKFMAENIETTLVNPQADKTALQNIQNILPLVTITGFPYETSDLCRVPEGFEPSLDLVTSLLNYFNELGPEFKFSEYRFPLEFFDSNRWKFDPEGKPVLDENLLKMFDYFYGSAVKKWVENFLFNSVSQLYINDVMYQGTDKLYCVPLVSGTNNEVICPTPTDTSKQEAASAFFEKIKALFYLFDPNSSEKDCLKMGYLVGRENDINKDSEARLERVSGEVGQNILTVKKAINLLNTTGTIIDKDKKTKDAYAINEVASDLLNCVVDLLFKPNSKKELDLYEKLESSMYELNNIITQWKTKETKAKDSADNFEQTLGNPAIQKLVSNDVSFTHLLSLQGNATNAQYYEAVAFFSNDQIQTSILSVVNLKNKMLERPNLTLPNTVEHDFLVSLANSSDVIALCDHIANDSPTNLYLDISQNPLFQQATLLVDTTLQKLHHISDIVQSVNRFFPPIRFSDLSAIQPLLSAHEFKILEAARRVDRGDQTLSDFMTLQDLSSENIADIKISYSTGQKNTTNPSQPDGFIRFLLDHWQPLLALSGVAILLSHLFSKTSLSKLSAASGLEAVSKVFEEFGDHKPFLIEYGTSVSFYLPSALWTHIKDEALQQDQARYISCTHGHLQDPNTHLAQMAGATSSVPSNDTMSNIPISRISFDTNTLTFDPTQASALAGKLAKLILSASSSNQQSDSQTFTDQMKLIAQNFVLRNYPGKRLSSERFSGPYVSNFVPESNTCQRLVLRPASYLASCATHRGVITQTLADTVLSGVEHLATLDFSSSPSRVTPDQNDKV